MNMSRRSLIKRCRTTATVYNGVRQVTQEENDQRKPGKEKEKNKCGRQASDAAG